MQNKQQQDPVLQIVENYQQLDYQLKAELFSRLASLEMPLNVAENHGIDDNYAFFDEQVIQQELRAEIIKLMLNLVITINKYDETYLSC